MNEFKRFHPIVNFTYFLFVIVFTCLFLHPITLAVSLSMGFVYSLMLKGTKKTKNKILYMLLAFLLMALINPAFNHEGVTILTYLPSGNPLTLESILYGLVSATMIVGVVLHFSCFNEVMTSDKIIYLFGKIIPSLSLIFSMVLRFIPKFYEQAKAVVANQKCIGNDISSGGVVKRAKRALTVLSVLVTWSLENAIDTSDSMKSRGYGLPDRTAFSIYTFSKRDKAALAVILVLSAYVVFGGISGSLKFVCFPAIQVADYSVFSLTVFVAYFILTALPVLIEVWEVRKWKSIR